MTRSSLRLPKLPAAIMLLLLLAGCGFHLRDALLPAKTTRPCGS